MRKSEMASKKVSQMTLRSRIHNDSSEKNGKSNVLHGMKTRTRVTKLNTGENTAKILKRQKTELDNDTFCVTTRSRVAKLIPKEEATRKLNRKIREVDCVTTHAKRVKRDVSSDVNNVSDKKYQERKQESKKRSIQDNSKPSLDKSEKHNAQDNLKSCSDNSKKNNVQDNSEPNWDNNVGKSVMKTDICCLCKDDYLKEISGRPENKCSTCKEIALTLIDCYGCSDKAHVACVRICEEFWRCPACKVCCICKTNGKKSSIICRKCNHRYHLQCHRPPVSESQTNWSCFLCTFSGDHYSLYPPFHHHNIDPRLYVEGKMEEVLASFDKGPKCNGQCTQKDNKIGQWSDNLYAEETKEEDIKTLRPRRTNNVFTSEISLSDDNHANNLKGETVVHAKKDRTNVDRNTVGAVICTTKPTDVKNEDTKNNDNKESRANDVHKMMDKIPDCKDWSPAQVEEFFIRYGFPYVGAVFRSEDIDGIALLLMTKRDVFQFKNFRVGTALKVYKLINILRFRRLDVDV